MKRQKQIEAGDLILYTLLLLISIVLADFCYRILAFRGVGGELPAGVSHLSLQSA